ncbi:thioredoxin [Leuconostocaceae bacterium ESL0958]|nr:thioredoxin [Leuconostocaceae bacterium ESL0958]
MAVEAITDANFKEKTAKGLVVTDFWATWCGPCKMQSPVLDAMSDEEAFQDVTFNKVDVDDNKETAAEFGIRAIPTLVITKDGEVVDRLTGFHDKGQMADILQKYR